MKWPSRIASVLVLLASLSVYAETIHYELYEISGDKSRTLLAKGVKQYTIRDVVVEEHMYTDGRWWSKELPVVNGFAAGVGVFRQPDLSGFGLWLKDHGTLIGRIAGGGFSWDWFDRDSGNVYRKLQGPGRVRVTLVQSKQFQEIASIEFLEDVTLRVNNRPWFFFTRSDTHHLVIGKGSVLRIAP